MFLVCVWLSALNYEIVMVQVFPERDFQHPQQEDLQLLPVPLVSAAFWDKLCVILGV